MSALKDALEAALINDLKSVHAATVIGEGDKREQGALWPPKERVALYKVVADYLDDGKQKLDNPDMGSALGRGPTNE